MKCPHCTTAFHDNWGNEFFIRGRTTISWRYRTAHCPACERLVIEFGRYAADDQGNALPIDWKMIYPGGANRGPVPAAVPEAIAADYVEACNVLPISAKASAALSRRCLQNILRNHGYKAKQLWQEIDLVLNETDTTKAIPTNLRITIDGIRHFGNFSAHPERDVHSLEIIDVEDDEAEWCLQILEDMFEHFYVRPADAQARKAALNTKLAAAGKPPAK